MKLIVAFFQLIRFVNLIFIVLTQALFQYFIIIPMFGDGDSSPSLPLRYFVLLSLSSVCIAAAGYIINDYFDLNIDRINRPDKLVVDKLIKRRWTIIWHWILSFAGLTLGFYVGWKAQAIWVGFANAGCIAALWFYSTTFKKKLLSGNILISLLTSWVILVIGFITHFRISMHPELYGTYGASRLLRFTFLYAGFAFIISLIREVIKDIQDMPGDQKYGGRTMPIVWGVHVSKVFAGTWLTVLIAALFIVEAYILQFRWWLTAAYCMLAIILPLLYVMKKLAKAQAPADFQHLSKLVKLVMLTGILSMVFFLKH